ncbi:hypothetical protein BaRGS_00006996 [Batillaria attramentaria]|uniref:Secreted protein n=1 Tax=Batillaria attramentaria TaxID=370345 RepID=A0ABD0LQ06_9CAEN
MRFSVTCKLLMLPVNPCKLFPHVLMYSFTRRQHRQALNVSHCDLCRKDTISQQLHAMRCQVLWQCEGALQTRSVGTNHRPKQTFPRESTEENLTLRNRTATEHQRDHDNL